MKMNRLSVDTKKTLLKAIQSGLIKKEDLKTVNGDEVQALLTNRYALIAVKLGDTVTFNFSGQQISENEYHRLSILRDALGIEGFHIVAKWNNNI